MNKELTPEAQVIISKIQDDIYREHGAHLAVPFMAANLLLTKCLTNPDLLAAQGLISNEWVKCEVGMEIPKGKVLCIDQSQEVYYGILSIVGINQQFECESDLTFGENITHYRQMDMPLPQSPKQ